MKTGIIKKRLREAFGDDVQETVASKLNMSQPNVSKLLSGNQMPTAEVLKSVSDAYGVSVDWLLGLSDEKRLHKNANTPTYEDAVNMILDLEAYGVIRAKTENGSTISYDICDPILYRLLQKGKKLKSTDQSFYQTWRGSRLSKFDGKEVLSDAVWEMDQGLEFYLHSANTESDLVKVYEMAYKKEQEYLAVAGPDPGLFDE